MLRMGSSMADASGKSVMKTGRGLGGFQDDGEFMCLGKRTEFEWSGDIILKECSATEWSFIEDESESLCVGFSKTGWLIVIINPDSNKYALDLK
jgi:hypothetical protein